MTEFCDMSATEVLSTESSEVTSDVTVRPTVCASASHEPSVSVVSRLSSEFTINSSDLVLRRRGRFAAVGAASALDGVSLPAGDGTPAEDATMTSGVVATGGVATRLVPPDGDGVASVVYSTQPTTSTTLTLQWHCLDGST